MADNTATKSTTANHIGHWTATATKSGTYEFHTADAYVDRDIDLVIPQASIGVSGTTINSTNAKATVAVSVGTKSGSTYPFSGSATISGTTSGTATATVNTAGFTDSSSYTGTVSGSVSGTAGVSGSMNAASVKVTGNATVKPNALATGTDNVSTGTVTTTKPTDGSYYVAATPSTAASTTITQSTTGSSTGYLGNISTEISASGTVAGGNGSEYYIPITSGALGNSSSDPGTSYTEATTTVPSQGWLTLTEGYYPNTKLSLDTILDGKSDTAGTASADIRTGKIAYSVDGEKLTGTMADATVSGSHAGSTATATAEAYASTSTLADGTYTTTSTAGYTYHVDSNASASDTGATAQKNITAGYLASDTSLLAIVEPASKSASSVVYLLDSTSSVADKGTIAAGGTLTIGKGYYPTDRTFTAQEAGSALTTSDITGTLEHAMSTGYNDAVLYESAASLAASLALTGNGTMTTGNIYSGSSTPKTQYIEVYTGTYSIS